MLIYKLGDVLQKVFHLLIQLRLLYVIVNVFMDIKYLGILLKLGKQQKAGFTDLNYILICNHEGELIDCKFTAGNVDDRAPVPDLAKDLSGKLFGDKGYISQTLFERLLERGLKLITGLKKNMKNKLMELFDRIMLRKRALIESINNQLKNVFQLEHTRHRNPINGLVNMLAAVVAYTHHANKPSIKLSKKEIVMLQKLAA